MSADKHPAEVLADTDVQTLADHLALDRAWLRDEYAVHIASMLGAERQLRRIPALEAERNQLRAEVDALREANSTFATASIMPDDKVIVDKAEIEALRADAERYSWVRQAEPFTLDRMMDACETADDFDAAVDAARKQQ